MLRMLSHVANRYNHQGSPGEHLGILTRVIRKGKGVKLYNKAC